MIVSSLAGLMCLALIAVGLFVWRSFQLHHAELARAWAEASAKILSRRDPMTGLLNRRACIDLLTEHLAQGRVAVLIINIDRLRLINSIYGQLAGDKVVRKVAAILRESGSQNCEVARIDGDGFAVLLFNPGGRLDVQSLAAHLLNKVEAGLKITDQPGQTTVSIGVAISAEHGATVDSLLHAADTALREAKAEGGNLLTFFDPLGDLAARDRDQLRQELRAAIVNGEIVPYYQPIVSLSDRRIVGFEVLARWVHPHRGVLSPEVFIPMAEAQRLSGPLSLSLLQSVIRDSQNWPSDLFFAFNASPGQLRELVGLIANPTVMPDGMLATSRIELELTEGALIQDMDLAREVIDMAHSLGIRVVLDDFGVGHSNFFHLRELAFDRIKIDKSFVISMTEDSRARACVAAILALGNILTVEIVAEGVETLETEQRLRQGGCQFGQGYLYSKPVPAIRVPEVLAQHRQTMEQTVLLRLKAS